ncbi:type II secretory pathway, ATPase PulE/Tfp pilus assembly pathway, ATPase PilB [Leptolyngbya sp. PCC 7375]|nr:type II secretory pathway, ATPase PulE/Tfp pilus assembly pathway, ATPase PilB [Leptolyngbya sp. PCC 7375]
MGRLSHSHDYTCTLVFVISFLAAIMSTFPENHALSPPSSHIHQPNVKTNLEQMFLLIEGILPFEACLYYQVLPLSIEGSSLNLGMVNPDDTKAADYVRRQVSYINCSIVSRPISSDWHREILSKFLSHSAKNRQASQPSQSKANSTSSPFQDQPTLVVGAPTEIIEHPHGVIAEQTTAPQQPASSPPVRAGKEDKKNSADMPPAPLSIELEESVTDLEESPSEKSLPAAEPPLSEHESLVLELPEPANKPSVPAAEEPLPPTDEPSSATAVKEPTAEPGPEVTFDPNRLNPKELTQILLKRLITQEGIGRLYLERQSTTCRILWSKDGVVQSVVNDISPQLFQGVINELKRMMSLSLIPVRKPKQIEIERIHNQKRILLRFRVMPGDHGEEATLQILRGAALKFYQQQQLDNLGRDALGIAQDLQQRIDDLRAQAQRNLEVQDDTKQKTLPAIMTMLKQMEQQLHDILEASD